MKSAVVDVKEHHMSISENILLGVFAGVMTSAIIFMFSQFMQKVILPWYKALIYRGIDVSDSWDMDVKHKDGTHAFSQRVTLRQSGHELSGDALTTIKSGKVVAQTVRGHVWEGYVALTYLPKDRKRTSYATAMLKVTNAGDSLDGYFVFRNNSEDKVVSVEGKLQRNSGKDPQRVEE